MRNRFWGILLAILLVTFMVIPTFADYVSGPIFYTINNGSATVTGCMEVAEEITVPAILGGCPVTTVAKRAFLSNEVIKVVNLPDTVTKVENGAFVPGITVNYYSTQPTTPTNPSTPTQPTTPSTPTNPSTPTQPTTPSTPTAPTNPSTPTQPTTPSTPTAPTNPSTPTQPTTPSTPTAPTSPSTPTLPTTPSSPTTPTKPISSGEVIEVILPSNPEEEIQPATNPTEATGNPTQATGTDPTGGTESTEGTVPAATVGAGHIEAEVDLEEVEANAETVVTTPNAQQETQQASAAISEQGPLETTPAVVPEEAPQNRLITIAVVAVLAVTAAGIGGAAALGYFKKKS